MTVKVLRFAGFAVFAWFGFAVPASAEIVFLKTGRTMNVAGHRVEGDTIVLSLRSGGEMAMDGGLIEKFTPDEVPWVDPRAVKAEPAKAAVAAQVPQFAVPAHVDAIIARAAEAHDVDPNLVRAVIKVESAYRSTARSNKGAMGLMQLMPGTARRLGVRKPFDAAENIRGGTQYMRELMDMFGGKVDLVLASYNAGEGAVLKYGRNVPPYRETRDYVKTIGKRYGLTGRQVGTQNDVPEPQR